MMTTWQLLRSETKTSYSLWWLDAVEVINPTPQCYLDLGPPLKWHVILYRLSLLIEHMMVLGELPVCKVEKNDHYSLCSTGSQWSLQQEPLSSPATGNQHYNQSGWWVRSTNSVHMQATVHVCVSTPRGTEDYAGWGDKGNRATAF